MKFMILVHTGDNKAYEAGQMPEDEMLLKMGKFNEELVDAGVMLAGEGLHPSKDSVRIKFVGNDKSITEGPFTVTEDFVAGYWLWNVDSKEEAVQWAKRAPMEEGATLEIRQIYESSDFSPEVQKQERALQKKMEQQEQSY
jgi:hypothetical protein